ACQGYMRKCGRDKPPCCKKLECSKTWRWCVWNPWE
uniref:Jingzhaotoxin F6-27.63 n=1 Tax=Chilobrachys guangxiensis TaxID=278060 RepID=JZ627_CHIGU|nr:RecName: Full=Jingzhaotoxin F6-27.63; AltName: Full=Peptide F6-27.63 [Chilobrachys guangxiensis]